MMKKIQNTNENIKDILSMGYGTPSRIILTSNISAQAKALYSYFCIYSDSQNNVSLPRIQICNELSIALKSFYKYRNELISNGYITVSRSNRANTAAYTIYHINHDLTQGYGILSKMILTSSISIQAKALYSYFCIYSNSENKAFPSRNRIYNELHISKDLFYKYIHELISNKYISITHSNKSSRFSPNIYVIEKFITINHCPKNPDTEIDHSSKNPDTERSKNPDTETHYYSQNSSTQTDHSSKNPDTETDHSSKNPDTVDHSSKNPDTERSKNPDTERSKNPDTYNNIIYNTNNIITTTTQYPKDTMDPKDTIDDQHIEELELLLLLPHKDIVLLFQTANKNIELIKEKFEVAKQSSTPIKNLTAFLLKAIKDDYKPPHQLTVTSTQPTQQSVKRNRFVNYEQRTWDFEELERLERERIIKKLEDDK